MYQKISFIIMIPILTSCGTNLEFLHGLAKVTNDNAITIEVQREALDAGNSIQIGLDVGGNVQEKSTP